MRQRIEGHPAKPVGCVVPLPERGCRVGIFMSAHGENQHGKGQHKIAELSIQETASFGGRRRLHARQGQSQNRAPLDLAHSLTFFGAKLDGAFRKELPVNEGRARIKSVPSACVRVVHAPFRTEPTGGLRTR